MDIGRFERLFWSEREAREQRVSLGYLLARASCSSRSKACPSFPMVARAPPMPVPAVVLAAPVLAPGEKDGSLGWSGVLVTS